MENLQIPDRMERLPMTGYQRKMALIICLSWLFVDTDLGTWNYLMSPIMESFNITQVQAGLLGSVSFVGMLVGALFAGFFSDKFGRKVILQFAMIIWGIGGILCALSWSYESLGIFRFFLGFGLGAELPVATTMLSEILSKSSRGKYVAIMEGLLPIGYIMAGLIAFFILPVQHDVSFENWRLVFFLEALPAFMLFVVRRSLPESPRWLESKGRTKEAKETIELFEKEVQRRTGRELKPVPPSNVKINRRDEKGFFGSLIDLWSPEYRKRTLMLWIVWCLLLFGYYGLATWYSTILKANGMTSSSSILFVVQMTAIGGIPGIFFAAYIIEKIGRKPMIVLSTIFTGVSAYLYGHASPDTLLIWGVCLQFCQYTMWSGVYAYTPELYPTHLRGTGVGWSNSIGRIGAVFGPSLVGIVLTSYGSNAVFTMGALAFVAASVAVLLLGVETKGKVLEELNEEANGQSSEQKGIVS
jgi:putative MFS transporter